MLTRLSALDLLWVAAVPGISEEFLFRGALIPATFPDWCAPGVAGPSALLPPSQAKSWTWEAVSEVERSGLTDQLGACVTRLQVTYCKAHAAEKHRESASCW